MPKDDIVLSKFATLAVENDIGLPFGISKMSFSKTSIQEHVPAKKQISLYKLPRILVFHIKRFQYKASKYFKYSVTARDKIKTYVDYDTQGLDMSNYCLDPENACPDGKDPIYDLIGVVNHMGTMVRKFFKIL